MAHKRLEVWKESISLVLDIYKTTQKFPQEELYGLAKQIRRCAVSIPSNIAEGCARQTHKESTQFLHISLGSGAELETQLIIANELGYIKNADELLDKLNQVRKMIVGLIKFYKTKT